MKLYGKILFVFVAAFLVGACVTTKRKGEEPGRVKKGYHDLTAKYNYWFNADELLTLTMADMESQFQDNYNRILPIYPYAEVDPLSSKPKLDDVIDKSSKAIGLHRISDWTDDCYTMIGQAQFLKRDYETAEATFKWIRMELDPKNKTGVKKKPKVKKKDKKRKKKKKKKRRPKRKKKKKKKKSSKKKNSKKKDKDKKEKEEEEKGLAYGVNPYKPKELQRFSSFPKAMIWFGRTLVAREKYDEAEFLYRGLHEDPWFPEDLMAEISLAEADMWMKRRRYDNAIAPLEAGIQHTKKRREKARLAYILSQLHEELGNYDKAYAALDVVLKSGPEYELEFNARLHQIYTGWTNGKINSSSAIKSLEKMTKDEKNLEYRDQIYYTLAEVNLADGEKDLAIANLKSSLVHNENNSVQRSESFLKLADLYYEAQVFVQAKLYYDSTLTVLPNTDERYARVKTYADNLKEIARLITTIEENDSIVRVFYMDESERKELAKQLKKQQKEAAAAAAARKAAEEEEKKSGKSGLPPAVAAGVKPSTFYFYNDAFVKKGKRDFKRTWGDRKLEDNWRRSNRLNAGAGIDDVAEVDADSTDDAGISSADLEDLFKGIPTSEAELAVLHASTYEAMYKLGVLYRDKLEDNKLSTTTHEDMLQRYPDLHQYDKETWYYCHLGFKALGNQQKAQFYLDKLVKGFPNSPYTRSLTDPNFLNATKEKERELSLFYEVTYENFQDGKYQTAFDRCQEAPKKYGSTNPLMPKFALLSALCTGNLKGNNAYCAALNEVIARYPDSPESTRAKEIARLLSCKGFQVKAKKTTGRKGKFNVDDDALHYFLIVIEDSKDVKLNDIKTSISDYNREFHRTESLRISNIYLGTDTNTPIVVIRKFDNKAKGMAYYAEVLKNKDFMGESKGVRYNKEMYVLTQANYRQVLKNRSLEGYPEFFEENYLN